MDDLVEHLKRLTEAEADVAPVPDLGLTPGERAIVARIIRFLHDRERDANERYLDCLDGGDVPPLNPFLHPRCEMPRVMAMAYRTARYAVQDAFPAQNPAQAEVLAARDTGGAA